jgi:aspartyl-tRNA(Asn)/glutamyl-tRNA(Gln) amidotransferase subunit A
MNFQEMTLKQMRDGVRSGSLKARALTEESLKRAKATNPKLNAFITICENEALKRADEVDKLVAAKKDPGILAGVPIAVKDLLCTKGVRTTAASKILDNFVPTYNATVVEKLEAAGAVIMGKANLDEFAMGASNENSAYGSVKNPYDLSRVPGGSSGGSAAAVAADIAPGAIGTDTGGSIREPASFCGISGIKPTYGRVSRFGVVAFASSLDQVGPMAKTTEDAAIMLEAISGKDQRDSTSADVAVPSWATNIQDNVKGLRIGLPKEYWVDGIEPEVRTALDKGIDLLKAQGATVVPVDLPLTSYGIAVYYIIAPCEASSNLARYDGVRYGHRSHDSKDLLDMYCRSRGEGFGPEPKRRIMLGTFALSSGYYEAYYRKACQVRRLIRDDFLKAFAKCDVIAGPVTTCPAFKLGEKSSDPLAMYLNDIFTLSPSLAGIPGLSVNVGYTKAGLPVGMQILAKHFEEDKMIRAAHTIEKHAGLRRPNVAV